MNSLSKVFVLVFLTASTAPAQDEAVELTDAEALLVAEDLRAALAGPGDLAFQQVLTDISVVADTLADTTFLFTVYDILVRYDPLRYQVPYARLYPVTFEEQFIHWGKRLALYSRSVRWQGGRYFLYDISSGRQAWMTLEDIQRLQPAPARLPPAVTPDKPENMAAWLKLIYAVDPATDIQTMGRWYNMIHHETREELTRRRQSAMSQATPPTTENP